MKNSGANAERLEELLGFVSAASASDGFVTGGPRSTWRGTAFVNWTQFDLPAPAFVRLGPIYVVIGIDQ